MEDRHPLDYYPEDDTGDELTDSLALVDRARAFLAQAETLSDIGAVREVAERARRYAKAARLGREAENHAARLRLDAERRAGQLLAQAPKNPGVRQSGGEKIPPPDDVPRLADLGVTKQQSKDWQAIARVPDEVFEAHVSEAQRKGDALTTGGVVQVARQLERAEKSAAPKPAPDLTAVPSTVHCEVADAMAMPLDRDSVHLIVTSPPYALDIQYEGGDVHPAAWDAFMTRWLMDALRVVAEGGRLALNVPLDTVVGGYRPAYAIAVAAAQRVGWTYRSTIVWADNERGKSSARGSVDSPNSPYIYAGAEMIALFSKGPWRLGRGSGTDLCHADWMDWTNGLWRFRGETLPWEGHPAAFPLELPRRLMLLLSYPGDVVLDPFCGSGTTLLAAHQLGRRAIGFDRSQKYVDSTLRRIEAHGRRPDAVHAAGIRGGLRDQGAETGESGGLSGRVDRGAPGTEEQELFPSRAAGIAI